MFSEFAFVEAACWFICEDYMYIKYYSILTAMLCDDSNSINQFLPSSISSVMKSNLSIVKLYVPLLNSLSNFFDKVTEPVFEINSLNYF